MIRVAVVGFGPAGRFFHAATIDAVEGLELAAIVQRSGSAAATAYPNVRIVPSVDELLRDSSIRLVVIATPNSSHFPIARQCLLADRDVVIDKPFALNSEEAAELIRLARSRHRLLTVFQNRRCDGDYRTVRTLLANNRLGRLVRFESRYDRYRPKPDLALWRNNGGPGSGILVDLGPHLVDMALSLLGLPEALWADIRTEREGGLSDDAFDLYLRYPSQPESPSASSPESSTSTRHHAGLTVWLHATCLACSPGPRFSLDGTLGTYRKFGIDPQEERLKAGDLFKSTPWGLEGKEYWGTLTVQEDGKAVNQLVPTEAGDYRTYYANVRDALLGNAALDVQPIEAWRTMRVLEMAIESSQNGRTLACDWGQEP